MNLNFHPAPGLSEIMGGWYSVPQNPITARAYGVTYTPGIGEILNSPTIHFNEPDNPLLNFVAGSTKPLGQSGCGCGTKGGCGSHAKGQINGAPVGVGDLTADFNTLSASISSGNIAAALTDTIIGIPVWSIGAALLLLMFAGGEKHSYYGRTKRATRAAAGAFA